MPTPPWTTNGYFLEYQEHILHTNIQNYIRSIRTYSQYLWCVDYHLIVSITNLQEDFQLSDVPAILFVKRFWSQRCCVHWVICNLHMHYNEMILWVVDEIHSDCVYDLFDVVEQKWWQLLLRWNGTSLAEALLPVGPGVLLPSRGSRT